MTRLNGHEQPIGEPTDVTGARPPVPAVLEGACTRLEPAAGHAPALFEALCRAEDDPLWTYLRQERPQSAAELDEALRAGATNGEVAWALLDEQGPAGFASLMRIDPANGSIEVGGICLSTRLQRTRAATESMYLLARHAFEDLGYRRYEWKCDSLNAPSRQAALRLGFTEEGTFRNALVYKGRNRDTTWFSITDQEWPRVGAALAAWLDDANFDEQGRQRTPLAQIRLSQAGQPEGT